MNNSIIDMSKIEDLVIFEGKYDEERIPFLITLSDDYDKAVDGELIYNRHNGDFYIKKTDGDVHIGKSFLNKLVDKKIADLRNGVPDNANTLEKLYKRYIKLKQWKESIDSINNSGEIDTLKKIIYMFKDMLKTDPTIIEIINNKVDIIEGKQLSEEDLTDELYEKLLSIQDNANNYTHPSTKQCAFQPGVLSVNGIYEGDIIITAKDLGLENVDPNANNYTHPIEKQCNVVGIESINGLTGDIAFDRSLIGLGNVDDEELYNGKGLPMFVDDRYMSPALVKIVIEKTIQYLYPRIKYSNIHEYSDHFLSANLD